MISLKDITHCVPTYVSSCVPIELVEVRELGNRLKTDDYHKFNESTDKPGPVVDSYSSRPAIARRLKQPTRSQREQRHTGPYLVLLRVEFTLQRTITSRPVRSYRTLSPLPIRRLAVSSLLHLSSVYTAQALPGTLLCEARTFLPVHK